MNKKRHNKSFVSDGQPLFTQQDFMWYFEQRVQDMVRNELEYMFQNMMYK